MKRMGNLIDSIAAYDNICLAFSKAATSKWNKPDVMRFSLSLDNSLNDIRRSILLGALPEGKYRYFQIYDPKLRTISVAPFSHRVLHHAVMNICGRYFDKASIFHSYACRKGKGSVAAISYLQSNMSPGGWYLKLDIRKYFDSIDHKILLSQCGRLFKDKSLLNLLKAIIVSYETTSGKGLPIGNLSSQYFANHYLSCLDRFIKEECGMRYYIRYMDDMLVFNESKEKLKAMRDEVIAFVNHKLGLRFKVAQINRQQVGIPFLGYRVYRNRMKLSPVSKRRFLKKWKIFDKMLLSKILTEQEYADRMRAMFSFAERADIRSLKLKYILKYGFISE